MTEMLPNCPVCGAISDWHEYETPGEFGVICCAPLTERCPLHCHVIPEIVWRAMAGKADEITELREGLEGLASSCDYTVKKSEKAMKHTRHELTQEALCADIQAYGYVASAIRALLKPRKTTEGKCDET